MNQLISIAPMMDCTDKHDRYFLRLISSHVLLYSEMITAQALKFGDKKKLLNFNAIEHPVALQLGGSDPVLLAECAKMGETEGYDEINLNVGCPSPRVSRGRFGACLMLEPDLVADSVSAMMSAVKLPVTVKCRIGVDHADSYEALSIFIQKIKNAGCQKFIIHARKAWLSGLSPKENREIPPLQYDVVANIKKDYPELTIILNGGLKTVSDVESALNLGVDGVMLGRVAYYQPFILHELDQRFFNVPTLSRHEIIEKFLPYIHEQIKNGVKLGSMTRHILGLFQGQRGAAHWRRTLSQQAYQPGAGIEVIRSALHFV